MRYEALHVLRGEDEIGIEEKQVRAIAHEETGDDAVARSGDQRVSHHRADLQVARRAAHEIAQAGFKVKLMQQIVDRVSGVDSTSHKEMQREFAGIQDEPLTTKIPMQQLRYALIRGELANQYQNIGEWDDWY
jgi:hypothetical protein